MDSTPRTGSTRTGSTLDSKEDSHRGWARHEIEESFSHPSPHPPHWREDFDVDSMGLDSKPE
jgi:hypothetical protein